MTLPSNLHKKYVNRFDELIKIGKTIAEKRNREGLESSLTEATKWKTNCVTLLSQVLQGSDALTKGLIGDFHFLKLSSVIRPDDLSMSEAIGKLEALREDFENGFLANLSMEIGAEIASDYMGQAEQLLSEGSSGSYDHVPAAVLTGAVLEKFLRTLCDQQTPPIPTFKTTPKGDVPLMLNSLIDELKKTGFFNELKAKQLRAWADIRNAAAHGKFDEFSRSDVEQMIQGVKYFLATLV